jgi:Tfp pilus assembly protein PilF
VVKVFLTTNFDRLIEKALEEEGIVPTVISTPDALEGSLPLAHAGVTVIKLHGDYRDTRIKNTMEELDEYHPAIDALLDRVLDEYAMVICGWSAQWDTALKRAFERCGSHRFTTFWAARRALTKSQQEVLEARKGVYVQVQGADAFFAELASKISALEDGDGMEPRSRGESALRRPSGTVSQAPKRSRERALLVAVAAVALVALVALARPSVSPPANPAANAPAGVGCGDRKFDASAVDAVRDGRARYVRYTQEAVSAARGDFQAAVTKDPDYALAYSWMSLMLWLEWDRQWSQNKGLLDEAYEYALQGVRLCPDLSETHRRLAWIALYRGHHSEAEGEVHRALEIASSSADALAYLAQIQNFAGRPREALSTIREAIRHNPHYPAFYALYKGHAHYLLEEPAEAIAALEDAVPRGVNLSPVHRLLAILHAEAGKSADARREVNKVLEINPESCLENWRRRLPYKGTEAVDRYIDGLERAGFPHCPRPTSP